MNGNFYFQKGAFFDIGALYSLERAIEWKQPLDCSGWEGHKENNDNRYQDILNNINVLIKDSRTHVLRGGYWYDRPRNCRSAYRYSRGLDPYDVGFRPVFSL